MSLRHAWTLHTAPALAALAVHVAGTLCLFALIEGVESRFAERMIGPLACLCLPLSIVLSALLGVPDKNPGNTWKSPGQRLSLRWVLLARCAASLAVWADLVVRAVRPGWHGWWTLAVAGGTWAALEVFLLLASPKPHPPDERRLPLFDAEDGSLRLNDGSARALPGMTRQHADSLRGLGVLKEVDSGRFESTLTDFEAGRCNVTLAFGTSLRGAVLVQARLARQTGGDRPRPEEEVGLWMTLFRRRYGVTPASDLPWGRIAFDGEGVTLDYRPEV